MCGDGAGRRDPHDEPGPDLALARLGRRRDHDPVDARPGDTLRGRLAEPLDLRRPPQSSGEAGAERAVLEDPDRDAIAALPAALDRPDPRRRGPAPGVVHDRRRHRSAAATTAAGTAPIARRRRRDRQLLDVEDVQRVVPRLVEPAAVRAQRHLAVRRGEGDRQRRRKARGHARFAEAGGERERTGHARQRALGTAARWQVDAARIGADRELADAAAGGLRGQHATGSGRDLGRRATLVGQRPVHVAREAGDRPARPQVGPAMSDQHVAGDAERARVEEDRRRRGGRAGRAGRHRRDAARERGRPGRVAREVRDPAGRDRAHVHVAAVRGDVDRAERHRHAGRGRHAARRCAARGGEAGGRGRGTGRHVALCLQQAFLLVGDVDRLSVRRDGDALGERQRARGEVAAGERRRRAAAAVRRRVIGGVPAAAPRQVAGRRVARPPEQSIRPGHGVDVPAVGGHGQADRVERQRTARVRRRGGRRAPIARPAAHVHAVRVRHRAVGRATEVRDARAGAHIHVSAPGRDHHPGPAIEHVRLGQHRAAAGTGLRDARLRHKVAGCGLGGCRDREHGDRYGQPAQASCRHRADHPTPAGGRS